MMVDYVQLTLFMFSGWFINLTLMLNDDSECLSDYYQGLAFNFKTWHTVDFSFTISIMFLLVIMMAWHNCRGCTIVILTYVYFFKVIWVVVGAFVLLIHVNFDRCNQRVIVYTGVQFMIFLPMLIYLPIKNILTKLQIQRQVARYARRVEAIKLPSNHPLKKYLESTKFLVEQGLTAMATDAEARNYDNVTQTIADSFEQQIKIWGLVGWIFSFIFAGKDHDTLESQFMTLDFGQNMLITLKTWLWVDGGSTLYLTLLFGLIAAKYYDKHQDDQDYDDHTFLWRIIRQKDWPREDIFLGRIAEISIVLKIAWMIVGYVIYLKFIDLNKCRDYTTDYLMFYFTWSIYIIAALVPIRLMNIG